MKRSAASGLDLWDIETGNLIGTFGTEEQAQEIVHELLCSNGIGYAHALDLGIQDATGHSRSIASGLALANRAGISDQSRLGAAVATATPDRRAADKLRGVRSDAFGRRPSVTPSQRVARRAS